MACYMFPFKFVERKDHIFNMGLKNSNQRQCYRGGSYDFCILILVLIKLLSKLGI